MTSRRKKTRGKKSSQQEPGRVKSQYQFGDDDSSDDNVSVISEFNEDISNLSMSDFDEVVETLTEKRSSIREASMKKLISLLRRRYEDDWLSNCQETISTYLQPIIKKGTGSEANLACELIQCMAITRGTDSASMFEQHKELLSDIMKNPKKSEKSRVATMQALALLCFVGAETADQTVALMDELRALFLGIKASSKGAATIVSESVSAYSLLMSTLSQKFISSLMSDLLPHLMALLEWNSVDIRLSVGELIAMMYSAHAEVAEQKDPRITTTRDVIKELSTDSNRRQNKKELRVQRSMFRNILATFEQDEQPTESMKIGAQQHEFRGWSKVRQIQEFRRILGSGLQIHLAKNPFLAEVFDLRVDPSLDAMTATERRIAKEEDMRVSKQKQRERFHNDRKRRDNKNAHVFAED